MALEIVVIGGVAGGATAAVNAARTDPGARITLVERTGRISQATCSFPYFVAGDFGEDKLSVRSPEDLSSGYGISVRTETEATEIDPHNRTVRVVSGGSRQTLSFDRLVIATGSRAVVPDLPGVELDGVYTMKSPEDALRTRKRMHAAASVVVAGAGVLGLEMVEAFTRLGKRVTLVEKQDRPLPWLHPEISAQVEDTLQRHGVELLTGAPLRRIESGRDGGASAAVAGAKRLDADLVQLCLGFRPEVGLAEAAGIRLGAGGTIAVDNSQATSAAGVYAAGDCCETFLLPLREKRFLPLANPANREGRTAGINAAGGSETTPPRTGSTALHCLDRVVAFAGARGAELEDSGISFCTTVSEAPDRSSSQPDAVPTTVVLYTESGSGRVLGGQMIGGEATAQRLNLLATAVYQSMTVRQLHELDLAYTPPVSPLWDPVQLAARKAMRD